MKVHGHFPSLDGCHSTRMPCFGMRLPLPRGIDCCRYSHFPHDCNLFGDYSSVLTFLGDQLPHCRCDRGFSFPSPACTPLPTRPRCGLRRCFLLFRASSRLRLFNRSSCTHVAPTRHSPAHCFHHSFCGAIHQPACPVFNVVCLWPVTESSVATIGRRHRLHHDNCSFAQHPHAVSDGGFAPERVG